MSVSARRMTDGPGGEPRFHYLVRWRDDQRIEHARMFPTEGEAAEFDGDVKAGRTEPRSERRRGPSPTFESEAMDWLATKQATKRAATAARYESHLRLHVLPAFGPMPVAVITRHHVQQWINILTRDNLSASTIGDIYRGVFKAVLNKAILDGRLAASPGTNQAGPASRSGAADLADRPADRKRSPGRSLASSKQVKHLQPRKDFTFGVELRKRLICGCCATD
jgi:Phage integrase, N-terminal SAM-like domain